MVSDGWNHSKLTTIINEAFYEIILKLQDKNSLISLGKRESWAELFNNKGLQQNGKNISFPKLFEKLGYKLDMKPDSLDFNQTWNGFSGFSSLELEDCIRVCFSNPRRLNFPDFPQTRGW